MSAPDPFALGGRNEESATDAVVFEDQELLALEQKYLDVLRRRTALPLYQGPEWEALDEELWRLIALIGDTPPKTSIGATVKLRLLLNEDRGIPADPGENDIKSLQQVFELVQRQGVELMEAIKAGLRNLLPADADDRLLGGQPLPGLC
ncbi:MAG TPA: hypothetical protein VFC56_15895 [Stellaceae bacterium]|nr:hypothetical protein [Stellaceae bacterium]